MKNDSSNIDPFGKLVDEYKERLRRGDKPSISEYVEKYPHFAEKIGNLFPVLGFMEEVAPGGDSLDKSPGPEPAAETGGKSHPKQIGDFRRDNRPKRLRRYLPGDARDDDRAEYGH